MLMTITNHTHPATDLGYLLHKNPNRMHVGEVAGGYSYLFYPVAEHHCCTAALVVDLDPIYLKKAMQSPSGEDGKLDEYVSDRPYVASSFMSVALNRMFTSALKGRCKDRPELVEQPLSLTIEIQVVRCTAGESFLRRLFEPLGYAIELTPHPFDPAFPEWGESPYYGVRLTATRPVHLVLTHLYVLLPVLDDDKHYWVTQTEVDKLLSAGAGWLDGHPDKEIIVKRYLRHLREFTHDALVRLVQEDVSEEQGSEIDETVLERPLSLNEERLQRVLEVVQRIKPRSVIDLGCGEGRLVQGLMKLPEIARISGMDVSLVRLDRARQRLHLERLPDHERARITLFQGSLMYRDERLEGYDLATLIEVIEHLDAERLPDLEHLLFGYALPQHVIVTTPNREYNVRFPGLAMDRQRHRDHRFEWTREEFQQWIARVEKNYPYQGVVEPIGTLDPEVGAPTMMAIFHYRKEGGA